MLPRLTLLAALFTLVQVVGIEDLRGSESTERILDRPHAFADVNGQVKEGIVRVRVVLAGSAADLAAKVTSEHAVHCGGLSSPVLGRFLYPHCAQLAPLYALEKASEEFVTVLLAPKSKLLADGAKLTGDEAGLSGLLA